MSACMGLPVHMGSGFRYTMDTLRPPFGCHASARALVALPRGNGKKSCTTKATSLVLLVSDGAHAIG